MGEHEQHLYGQLLHALDQIEPWLQRLSPDTPKPTLGARSPMVGDDRKVHPYEVSHAAWNALSHAVDHLHMLRSVLRDARVAHMFAPYTLVRAAMENAGAAVWMLAPDNRAERITRRLRLAALDIHNGEQVKQLLSHAGPRSVEERRDDLRNIANEEGLDQALVLNRPSYGKIVSAAGEHVAMGPKVANLVWRACSGIAHGDLWATISVLSREELPDAPAGMAHMRVTASVETLLFVTHFATKMTSRGWALYDARARSPY